MNKYAILIPSYNSTVSEINSTFMQLPINVPIYVIDDGSEIPFEVQAKHVLTNFPLLNIIRFEKNKGIEHALNAGLDLIIENFTYVARIDIGDSCSPERFIEQIKFMEENKDYSIVGCWASFYNENKDFLFVKKMPLQDKNIRRYMYINNAFVHPSVMMRCSSVKAVGGYGYKYAACEDYDLFFRLMHVGKVKNFDKAWVNYEVSSKSISSLKRKIQVKNRIKIIVANFTFIENGIYPYYGLSRNIIMYFIGRNITTWLQKKMNRS
ncbi:TPA: glycosyltransferase [Raoultella ornithinolytica]|nr:glycosyltransferase [Raoultella ornithinolytica]